MSPMTLAEEVRARRDAPSPAEARAMRRAAGVTQQRMAEEIGVARMTLARWESGERRPHPLPAARWAVVLDQVFRALSTDDSTDVSTDEAGHDAVRGVPA